MSALSGVPILIVFFLFGLVEGGWTSISGKVMGVLFIIAAVLILIDLLYAHRTLFVRRTATPTVTQ